MRGKVYYSKCVLKRASIVEVWFGGLAQVIPNGGRLETELTSRAVNWINDQARKLNIAVTIYPESIVLDGNWLRVPVTVNQGGDAYDRATWLQSIEDEWDTKTLNGLKLLLVPAKSSEPSKTDLYASVAELLKRQHLLLDRIDEEGADAAATVQRFQSIRQEWEETLQEMDKLYPSLKNGVT